MDGESLSLYQNYIHARSIDSNSHPSQSWVRQLHSKIKFDIPLGWRICGENLYATHTIRYKNLSSYFLVFSIWDDCNQCLSWTDTIDWCEMLGLETVPVLYEGKFSLEVIEDLKEKEFIPKDLSKSEGYVVRLAKEFPYSEFRNSCAKFVRKEHVPDSVQNWRNEWYDCPGKINRLKDS